MKWISVADRLPDLFDGCTGECCGGGPITWSDDVLVIHPDGSELKVTYDHEDNHWWLSKNGQSLDFTPSHWRELE